MILSVPEGDDKPLKYPLMFSVCDVVILNKTDYLEGSDFDVPAFRERVGRLNASAPILEVSCRTGRASTPGLTGSGPRQMRFEEVFLAKIPQFDRLGGNAVKPPGAPVRSAPIPGSRHRARTPPLPPPRRRYGRGHPPVRQVHGDLGDSSALQEDPMARSAGRPPPDSRIERRSAGQVHFVRIQVLH